MLRNAWIVVATCVLWAAVVEPRLWALPSFDERILTATLTEVSFTTNGATGESFSEFMEVMRSQLANPDDKRYGIRVTREPKTEPETEDFLPVNLLISVSGASITLAVDSFDVNIVAYQGGSKSYFFSDAPPSSYHLFPGTEKTKLQFTTSYSDLEELAGSSREDIDLGIQELQKSICWLHKTNIDQQNTLARHLLVVIQMVSEATRFRHIEGQVIQQGVSDAFRPDGTMLSLEDKWGALSGAIQNSNQGTFAEPIHLHNHDHNLKLVDNLKNVRSVIGLMLFSCRQKQPTSPKLNGIRSVVSDGRDNCVIPEPTVRITGRDGGCAGVMNGESGNGNLVQLLSCESANPINQLWKMKRNGTILNDGMCMTTHASDPTALVTVYRCAEVPPDTTLWKVKDNGNVVSRRTALVLSASPSGNGELSVDTRTYASYQGWFFSNETRHFLTTIVGYKGLCMQANSNNVSVMKCARGTEDQKWALYADGTIRPQRNHEGCLTSKGDSPGSIVYVESCALASSKQRWLFANDGTILNLYSELVMDVKNADPSLQQIIIYKPTGSPKQVWFTLF